MKILLVEDDEDKRENLSNFIVENFTADLDVAKSFHSGKRAINTEVYDLMILDMTIPTFDITPSEFGGRSQPFGGKMLLYEMSRKNVETNVIIVTQFDIFGKGDEEMTLVDLDLQLKQLFPKMYLGAIPYSVTYNGWRDKLYTKIKSIFR